MADGDMLTVKQAAARLGLAKSTLNAAIQDGRLAQAQREGGRWLIPIEAVDALRKDKFGRILWSGRAVTAGRKPGARRVKPPKCKSCGILLAESGDELHQADPPDAKVCWMCRAHLAAAKQSLATWCGECSGGALGGDGGRNADDTAGAVSVDPATGDH